MLWCREMVKQSRKLLNKRSYNYYKSNQKKIMTEEEKVVDEVEEEVDEETPEEETIDEIVE